MTSKIPTIFIVFGASGDLAQRYLLPAIEAIAKAKMLPDEFQIVGVTRKSGSEYFQMDVTDKNEYEKLNNHLNEIEKKFSVPAQRLFYLAVPPEACKDIIEFIGKSSLIKHANNKLLLEKPFGTDLSSAKDLVKHVDKYFLPTQVYRVDHYMAKEISQNLIVFRDGNSLFKKTWNKDFIESIEIIASEKKDIEGRANFYEQAGALRDVVQSHLLQLAALALMDLPSSLVDVPKLRLQALKQLNIVCNINDSGCVKRAQYKDYRKEVDNPSSMVETFVSINLQSNNPKLVGIPITLTTGKALKDGFTVIKIRYKKDKENESNELLLRVQPDAGIEFSMWAKKPGLEHQVSRHVLHFLFKEYYGELPNAYEQVLFNAINSDHNLFTSSEEIIETWRILDEIQKMWQKNHTDLVFYNKGSSIEQIMENI